MKKQMIDGNPGFVYPEEWIGGSDEIGRPIDYTQI